MAIEGILTKAVVVIHCLLVLSLLFVCVMSLFCYAVLCDLLSFVIISLADLFLLSSCYSSFPLPHAPFVGQQFIYMAYPGHTYWNMKVKTNKHVVDYRFIAKQRNNTAANIIICFQYL